MPWLRIDENAMEHPKITGLPDGAFRLWVQGLAYCQKFLTDGVIVDIGLRSLRAYSQKRKGCLTDVGLWDIIEAGVTVHDFLDWNDSREQVQSARQGARERMQKLRGSSREQTPKFAGSSRLPSPTPQHTTPPTRSGEPNGGESAARSKRPIFKGTRFVVFEWQLDDLRKMLGPHVDAFDLHEWFFTLSAKADAANIVIPQRDGGKWLYEQTLQEAIRRGLPVAIAVGTSKTAGNVAALARFAAKGATA